MANPHDALFKSTFSDPQHAGGLLRKALTGEVTRAIDWSTLAHSPGSFVDTELLERHTDLLFSAQWQRGKKVLLYLLFEHQSTHDAWMAFRLLRYMVRIWERWQIEHPESRKLPVVLPIVLYHGEGTWTVSRAFDALFDFPPDMFKALASHLVKFTYTLEDLSAVPDEELRRAASMTALAALVALCFKHARSQNNLLETMSEWTDVICEVVAAPHGLEALRLVMRYILMVNEHIESGALEAFLESKIGKEAKEIVMTAGEQLILQGKRDILLQLTRQRFSSKLDAGAEHRIAAASTEQIDAWSKRLLTATTVGEMLAD